jgi:hypothetical protein
LLFIRLVKKKEAGAEMASATPAVASETTPTTTTETPPPPVAEKEAASPAAVAESKSIPRTVACLSLSLSSWCSLPCLFP